MSGRYAFSLPEPRRRDGWFQLGSIDMTTTALVVAAGVVSMVLYAIDPAILARGYFATFFVREGEVWRLVLWPLVNPPLSIFVFIALLLFWFFGHRIEEEVGRKPWAVIVTAMAVVPAVLVTLVSIVLDDPLGRWQAGAAGVTTFALAALAIYGIEYPNIRFVFGIPAWVIAAAYVFIEVLRDVGNRAWGQIALLLLVIAVGCFGTAQRGMLAHLSWIPRFAKLGARYPSGRSSRSPRSQRRTKSPRPSSGTTVTGPWPGSGGPTPLEQAELDALLDRISAGGLDSLTPAERTRLEELSRRMRDS